MIDPDDERTELSKRKGPAAPAPEPEAGDALDDRTMPTRRTRAGAPPAATPPPAEAAPRRSSPRTADLDVTVVSARSAVSPDSEVPTQASTDPGPVGPRRTGRPGDEDAADGWTTVTRGSRAAAAPTVSTAREDLSAPGGRVASSPDAGTTAYPVRPMPPTGPSRTESARGVPQAYVDTAAAAAGIRRRRRRRFVVVVAVAAVLVGAAALALWVLLTLG